MAQDVLKPLSAENLERQQPQPLLQALVIQESSHSTQLAGVQEVTAHLSQRYGLIFRKSCVDDPYGSLPIQDTLWPYEYIGIILLHTQCFHNHFSIYFVLLFLCICDYRSFTFSSCSARWDITSCQGQCWGIAFQQPTAYLCLLNKQPEVIRDKLKLILCKSC